MVTLTSVLVTTAGLLGVTVALVLLALVAAAPWFARHDPDGLSRRG